MPEKLKGLCKDNIIYLNPNQSSEQLVGTLGEEIAHYLTNVGNITAQDTSKKRKQEQKSRDLGITVETLDEATNVCATFNDGKLD